MPAAQFTCDICGAGFAQRSRLDRHRQTAHPPQAPSAADVEQAIGGIAFPCDRQALLEQAEINDSDATTRERLQRLPEQTYRDAAEVARALGGVIAHMAKPTHQPSRRGGERARKAPSAAHVAEIMRGMSFPTDAEGLRRHAQRHGDPQAQAIVDRFRQGTYRDMADVAREIGAVT